MKTLLLALLIPGALAADSPCPCPLAGKPTVELRGTVERVKISRGEGMPFLEINDGKKSSRVYLGSIRYLLEQDFNPKAGQKVSVTAYEVADGYIAAVVTLSETGQVLRLRDDRGFPTWRGGASRGGPRRGPR